MRKVIAAINMSLDGYCDHNKMEADEEIHDHYTQLLYKGGIILYGRKTFQLMEFWPSLLKQPSGERSMDEFAVAIDNIPKLVFSNTIKEIKWSTASLAQKSLEEEVRILRTQVGKDIFVGSRSLIVQLLNLQLLDELQLCIHPVLVGNGLPLFEHTNPVIKFKHKRTKVFKKSGALLVTYGWDG